MANIETKNSCFNYYCTQTYTSCQNDSNYSSFSNASCSSSSFNINSIELDKENNTPNSNSSSCHSNQHFSNNNKGVKRKKFCENENDNKEKVVEVKTTTDASNQNIDLTMCNYRQRVFAESKKSLPKFMYRPGIYIEDYFDQYSTKNMSDEEIFNEKINKIRLEKEAKKRMYDLLYESSFNELKKTNVKELAKAKRTLKSKWILLRKARDDIKQMYESTLNQIKQIHKEQVEKLESDTIEKIEALTSLYEMGAYQSGKLSEYDTMEVYQPKAKRRKYDDDGHRKVLLPQTIIRNILIEDHIYNYHYGIPE